MSADPFVDYYESQSQSPATIEHFARLRDSLLRIHGSRQGSDPIRVADIGCGAGTLSRMWCQAGCAVSGLDVNDKLVEIARSRAAREGLQIDFTVGTAERLPWPDDNFDIVVMPELLEHVPGWQVCMSEAVRVLRRGGIVYISTTNRLCPVQHEFELFAYSWYPAWLKKWCLTKAMSTHRAWVNHAKFPAVNWFDPYSLAADFRRRGLESLDRFDILARFTASGAKRNIAIVVASIWPLRFLGHLASSSTILVGRKQ